MQLRNKQVPISEFFGAQQGVVLIDDSDDDTPVLGAVHRDLAETTLLQEEPEPAPGTPPGVDAAAVPLYTTEEMARDNTIGNQLLQKVVEIEERRLKPGASDTVFAQALATQFVTFNREMWKHLGELSSTFQEAMQHVVFDPNGSVTREEFLRNAREYVQKQSGAADVQPVFRRKYQEAHMRAALDSEEACYFGRRTPSLCALDEIMREQNYYMTGERSEMRLAPAVCIKPYKMCIFCVRYAAMKSVLCRRRDPSSECLLLYTVLVGVHGEYAAENCIMDRATSTASAGMLPVLFQSILDLDLQLTPDGRWYVRDLLPMPSRENSLGF